MERSLTFQLLDSPVPLARQPGSPPYQRQILWEIIVQFPLRDIYISSGITRPLTTSLFDLSFCDLLIFHSGYTPFIVIGSMWKGTTPHIMFPLRPQIFGRIFPPTWSCVSLTRSTTSSEWKLFRFDKMEVNSFQILLVDVKFYLDHI